MSNSGTKILKGCLSTILYAIVIVLLISAILAKETSIALLVLVLIILAIAIRLSRKRQRFIKGRIYRLYKDIDSFEPDEFEYFCAELLEDNGFSKVRVTQRSRDHGADIIAHKDGKMYVVQVKHYSRKVGNKAIQEVYAARDLYRADYAYAMANQPFTSQAIQEAKILNVGLWDRNDIFRFMDNAKEKYTKEISAEEHYVLIEKQKLLQQALSGLITTDEMLRKGKELDKLVNKSQESTNVEEYAPPCPYTKGSYNHEKGVYCPGCFTIGQDIPTGRYLFTAMGDKGRIEIYMSFEAFQNDDFLEVHTFDTEYKKILDKQGMFISVDNAETKLVRQT